MARKLTTSGQVVLDYLDKFPKATTGTLSRKAYKENPKLWSTEVTCNTAFRRARGQQGNKSRSETAIKSHFGPPGQCKGFEKLPDGIDDLQDWHAEKVDLAGHWAVLGDLHIPYHDLTPIKAALKEAKRRKVVGILINGDFGDFYAMSRWEQDPRNRDFPYELQVMRDFLEALRGYFPHTEIILKKGNHDERYEKWMMVKAPELLDIPEFSFPEITHATKHGIKVIGDCRPVKLGKLWTLHGHEYKGGISTAVNPARGLYLKAKVSAVCHHFHNNSSHTEPDLAEHLVTTWSSGCLCKRPGYAPLAKWNHGAAMVHIANDGAYDMDNYRIIDGKIRS